MRCNHCNKTIEGKGKKVGPRMVFCSQKCFVQSAYRRHPGTSLAKMAERMYPEWTIEGDK